MGKGLMDGKVCLITGGACGIGEETAYTFTRHGARGIVLVDLNAERMENVVKNIKAIDPETKVLPYVKNVTNEEDCISIMDTTVAEFGAIDALVNSAGISRAVPLEELDMARWSEMLSINLDATFIYCREAFKRMKKQGSGTIVNISSMGAQVGGVFAGAHYVASKGAVISLTKHVALAGAKFNVRCNCLAPSYIATPMMANLASEEEIVKKIPMGHQGRAIDVANAILFFSSEMSAYSTGAMLNVNGGSYM